MPQKMKIENLAQSWRIADLAAALGQSLVIIGRWFDNFRPGGFKVVSQRSHSVYSPQLDRESQQALKRGLSGGRWKTTKEIQQWLIEDRRIHLSISGIHYWLTKNAIY